MGWFVSGWRILFWCTISLDNQLRSLRYLILLGDNNFYGYKGLFEYKKVVSHKSLSRKENSRMSLSRKKNKIKAILNS